MRAQRGSVIIFALAALAVLILGFVACDALFDDESESNDLGWSPASHHHDGGGDDRSDGKNSRGKCEGAGYCDDKDFSPSFDESPVILCLPGSTCQFGDGEQASLIPPNPEKLTEAITGGAKAIGEAAGIMAGAIAALPIAILL